MSLQNASILTGATLSATGGTAQSFVPDGLEVKGGVHVVDASVADFRIRPAITAKSTQPATLPNGTFTKDKRIITYVEPFIDSKGVIQYDYVKIERRMHPESTSAKGVSLLNKGAQLMFDTDTTNFWALGSPA